MDKVAIVMAVYEPNEDWLKSQLLSLDAQSYPEIAVVIRDDASPTYPFSRLEAVVRECITRFPYTLYRNEQNLGSNQTFSLLTQDARGDLIAYCDSDDVWDKDKIAKLAAAFQDPKVTMSLCDLSVIDGEGNPTASSITKVKPHIRYQSGEGLAPFFLSGNFVTGCALMVRLPIALTATPFVKGMYHDQWLALCAARQGKLCFVNEPLVRYRIHQTNQTPTLGKIACKADYVRLRVEPFANRLEELKARVDLGLPQRRAEDWAKARVALSRREKGAWTRLFRLRDVNPSISLFELMMPMMPEALFRFAIGRMQRGKL